MIVNARIKNYIINCRIKRWRCILTRFIEYEWDELPIKWNEKDNDLELSEQYLELERFKSAIHSAFSVYKDFIDIDFYEIQGA
jgi:hypothetical protein